MDLRHAFALVAPPVLLVSLALATPAHAAVEEKGRVSAVYTDDAGVNHYLSSWMNVDYTNHVIRPYADHLTYDGGSYKGVQIDFRKDCCSI
jgi:hypothetical protein